MELQVKLESFFPNTLASAFFCHIHAFVSCHFSYTFGCFAHQCQQIESTGYIFEPGTVQRMELFVLAELDWRLRSLTPFAFINLFACKADSSGRCTRSLVLRACQITIDAIHGTTNLLFFVT